MEYSKTIIISSDNRGILNTMQGKIHPQVSKSYGEVKHFR